MRIIGGTVKGTLIKSLKGEEVRPTSDKVREALFDILYGRLEGATFLDCYAGSGAIGIEALSRGASKAVFVEKDGKVASLIRQNLTKCKLEEKAIIIKGDFESSVGDIKKHQDSFDIVFADPPYQGADYRKIVEIVEGEGLLEENGILIIEHLKKAEVPAEWNRIRSFKRKNYGQTTLSFYQSR
ncbi:MAG: 16S rRNA (guanine(966)-N(2))-methyltransferase RsmD [Acidobacteriota bacterium]